MTFRQSILNASFMATFACDLRMPAWLRILSFNTYTLKFLFHYTLLSLLYCIGLPISYVH